MRALAVLLLVASPAAAQEPAFFDAFLEFHVLLDGIDGDEGPQLLSALERMARTAATAPSTFAREIEQRLKDRPLLPPAAYAAGYAHLARGEYREAMAALRQAAERDPLVADPAARPESAEAHRVLGLAYWTQSRDDESITHLTIAIRRNPRDERSRLALSRVLSSTGRDSDAERILVETIAVLPGSVQAHWWLGSTYERLNRTVEARSAFERAASGAAAGHALIYAAIGRLASRGGDVAGAVEAFMRAVAARPNDAVLRKALTGALLQQDRAGEALIELQAALRVDPGDAAAHAAIGQIHLDAGRLDDAVTSLWRALALSPGHTGARYALATALLRLGRTAEADTQFSRVAHEQRQELEQRRRTMIRDVQNAGSAVGR